MKHMIRLLALTLALGWFTLPAASADSAAPDSSAPAKPTVKASDLFPDTVIAKGKGVEVKRSQLDDEVVRVKAQALAARQPIPPDKVNLLEQQLLDQMIQLQLINAKASEAEKSDAKKQAEKQLAEAKTQLGSDENLNLRLKAQGLTRQDLLAKWTEGETAKNVLVRELKINIPEQELKKFYDDNPAQFEEPEMVRASHILLSTREADNVKELPEEKKAAKHKLAEELVKRARAGEDFAKLAREYSEDPGSKDNGGEYKFPRGQMVKEFETAAFNLKTNEVSDIVTTQFGYHIIKLSQKYPAKKHELSEVAPRIKDYLTQVAIQKQSGPYIEQLKKDAGVEILDDQLKPPPSANAAALPSGHPSIEPTGKNK
jgi:peptidyl-prolyl cis-trans isomerase C